MIAKFHIGIKYRYFSWIINVMQCCSSRDRHLFCLVQANNLSRIGHGINHSSELLVVIAANRLTYRPDHP